MAEAGEVNIDQAIVGRLLREHDASRPSPVLAISLMVMTMGALLSGGSLLLSGASGGNPLLLREQNTLYG